jgi:hypothetical protein
MVANRLNDQFLNLGGRDPSHRSGPVGLTLQEGGGKVISVSHPLLAGVARGQAITTVVKQASHQQSVRTGPQRLVIGLLLAQLSLDCIEKSAIEYVPLLTGYDLAFECDLATTKP